MAIFSTAEARIWSRGQLADAALFPDAVITAKEVALRAKLERIIGVALSSTAHTEFYDGDDTDTLLLRHHNPYSDPTPAPVTLTSVTVIATDNTETAFTVAELADVVKYPDKLVRRSGTFEEGSRNIKVVYTTGYTAIPDDLKQAALRACVQELVPTSRPSGYIGGTEGQINFAHIRDADRGRWFGDEDIDSILREYRTAENARDAIPGIA